MRAVRRRAIGVRLVDSTCDCVQLSRSGRAMNDTARVVLRDASRVPIESWITGTPHPGRPPRACACVVTHSFRNFSPSHLLPSLRTQTLFALTTSMSHGCAERQKCRRRRTSSRMASDHRLAVERRGAHSQASGRPATGLQFRHGRAGQDHHDQIDTIGSRLRVVPRHTTHPGPGGGPPFPRPEVAGTWSGWNFAPWASPRGDGSVSP